MSRCIGSWSCSSAARRSSNTVEASTETLWPLRSTTVKRMARDNTGSCEMGIFSHASAASVIQGCHLYGNLKKQNETYLSVFKTSISWCFVGSEKFTGTLPRTWAKIPSDLNPAPSQHGQGVLWHAFFNQQGINWKATPVPPFRCSCFVNWVISTSSNSLVEARSKARWCAAPGAMPTSASPQSANNGRGWRKTWNEKHLIYLKITKLWIVDGYPHWNLKSKIYYVI